MIRLKKSELLEIGAVALAANTPRSLFEGLLRTNTVSRLRDEATQAELAVYFDYVTTRARRTEIDIALAYSVLLGILLNRKGRDLNAALNVSRLTWGGAFEKLASVQPSSQLVNVTTQPLTKVTTSTARESKIIIPAGHTHRWEANK